MNLRKHLLETLTILIVAVLCATISNALAGRERKMVWVGTYPNATKVTAAAQEPPATTTVAPAPVSIPAPAPVTTTTIAPLPQPAPPSAAPTADRRPPTATATAPPPQPAKQFTPHPDHPYIEIAFDDVDALYKQSALFLDARRTSVYEQGHIAGARPFSVWESDVDEKVNKLFEERGDPREQAKPILIYCSGGDCEDSHMLAQKLWGIQFNNVYVYKDGFPDWEKHHAAIQTGANP